jgi:hypothetical protein
MAAITLTLAEERIPLEVTDDQFAKFAFWANKRRIEGAIDADLVALGGRNALIRTFAQLRPYKDLILRGATDDEVLVAVLSILKGETMVITRDFADGD